eukprot:scaffold14563_cov242-Isochrysis_galbana.AAC.1
MAADIGRMPTPKRPGDAKREMVRRSRADRSSPTAALCTRGVAGAPCGVDSKCLSRCFEAGFRGRRSTPRAAVHGVASSPAQATTARYTACGASRSADAEVMTHVDTKRA